MTKWVFGILISILVIISTLFIRLIVLNSTVDDNEAVQNIRYHVQISVQDNDQYFWSLFREGALAAGEEFSTYVEFVPIARLSADELLSMTEMAVYSHVDGIALQAADVEQTQAMIGQAAAAGLKVVTYESDNFMIPDVPMIGSNNFNIGRLAGQMTVDAVGDGARIAVVFNKTGGQSDAQQQNLIMQGIMEASSRVSHFEIVGTYILDTELFEADEKSRQLLDNDPNVIICIDERSTPAVAQMLVNSNLVGDVVMIGYGAMPQTLDYIQRGVIFGSVCPDAYNIGYYTVSQLARLLGGDQVSDFINPELQRVDIDNVEKYLYPEN